MLRHTGHLSPDSGVATIAAFCGKTDPVSLTEKDLAKTAKFLEPEYFSGKLLSYREKIEEFTRQGMAVQVGVVEPRLSGETTR